MHYLLNLFRTAGDKLVYYRTMDAFGKLTLLVRCKRIYWRQLSMYYVLRLVPSQNFKNGNEFFIEPAVRANMKEELREGHLV